MSTSAPVIITSRLSELRMFHASPKHSPHPPFFPRQFGRSAEPRGLLTTWDGHRIRRGAWHAPNPQPTWLGSLNASVGYWAHAMRPYEPGALRQTFRERTSHHHADAKRFFGFASG